VCCGFDGDFDGNCAIVGNEDGHRTLRETEIQDKG